MTRDVNMVVLVGRLVRDPELRYTANNHPLASFSIANNRGYMSKNGNVDKVSFLSCIAWNSLAEFISRYCKKGSKVSVTGEIQQRSWKDEQGKNHSVVEIMVSELQMLDRKESNGESVTADRTGDSANEGFKAGRPGDDVEFYPPDGFNAADLPISL